MVYSSLWREWRILWARSYGKVHYGCMESGCALFLIIGSNSFTRDKKLRLISMLGIASFFSVVKVPTKSFYRKRSRIIGIK